MSRSLARFAAALCLAAAACSSSGVTAPGTTPTTPGTTPTPSAQASRQATRTADPAPVALTSVSLAGGPFSAGRTPGPLTASGARALATTLFPGATILEVESELERGVSVWAVKFRTTEGGIVELSFAQDSSYFVEAQGKLGPFTYAFAPGAPFITLGAALAAATGSAGKAGTVTQWKLELEDSTAWQYRVFVSAPDGLFRVRVDAKTGAVLRADLQRGGGAGAESDDSLPQVAVPDSIVAKALALVPGATVTEAETEVEHGIVVFQVKLQAKTGGEVEVQLLASGALFEIEGEKGPFDYDVNPGTGIVSFSAARTAALAAKAGTIKVWELERDANGTWYYYFRLDTAEGNWEVEIGADGAVLFSRTR